VIHKVNYAGWNEKPADKTYNSTENVFGMLPFSGHTMLDLW